MTPVIDMDKEYGLVLEGGGAKGAYQIGVWKALLEAGVKIKGVAGTSVGALNGALICMGDLEKAERLWKEISYSKVMDVDDEIMHQMINKEIGTGEGLRLMLGIAGEGGLDVTPLKELIAENIDEEIVRNSGMDFYILTFSVTDFKELDIDMKEVEEGLMPDLLLASAYIFPVFKNERLHGKKYIDGGIINNVPLESLVKRGYKDIITVRIYGIGREKKVKLEEDVQVHAIAPRVNLGNIMDFDSRKSIRNMKIGYFDAMRMIYGLAGKIYYIEQMGEECYYLKQLLLVSDDVLQFYTTLYKLDEEVGLRYRNYVEVVLPILANELKLKRGWSYQELYIALLEASAKAFRISKYKIYTPMSLLAAIEQKAKEWQGEELPAFVAVILKRVPYEEEEEQS